MTDTPRGKHSFPAIGTQGLWKRLLQQLLPEAFEVQIVWKSRGIGKHDLTERIATSDGAYRIICRSVFVGPLQMRWQMIATDA